MKNISTGNQYNDAALNLVRAFGYLTPYEMFAMQILARSYDPPHAYGPVIVNVGAGTGTSALSMTLARPDSTIYTIDISPSGPLGGMENERNAFSNAGLRRNPDLQILSNSQTFKWGPDYPAPDIIFIDADHSDSGVRADIKNWKPFVPIGGIFIFHDYERDVWPAVKNAVDEMVGADPKFQEIIWIDTLIAFRRIK